MKVRLAAKGWETFTGSFGFQAEFKNGVSVGDLSPRQVARIASTTRVVDAETGEQVGPSVIALAVHSATMPAAPTVKTKVDTDREEEIDRARLLKEQAEREAQQAAALAEAEAKAERQEDKDIIVYSRQELEAIGANAGISGLREIATPLGVKGRAISELVTEILAAQAKKVAE